jgi:CheY-like chemotaxis protein
VNILIVDDDPAILAMCRKLLDTTGHTLFEAHSALEAIDLIEHNTLHAAIIDYELRTPLSGLDVARHTRLQTVRIILTGKDPAILRPRIERPLSTFFAILRKPVDPKKLLHLMDRVEAMQDTTAK